MTRFPHLPVPEQLAELEWLLKNETDERLRAVIKTEYEELHVRVNGREDHRAGGEGYVDDVGKGE